MSEIQRINAFTELPAIQADDAGKTLAPNEIEIFQEGSWNGPNHPKFAITADDLQGYAKNFKAGVRKAVPIDFEHRSDPFYGKRAGGWLNDVFVKTKANGKQALFGKVEWNKLGADAVTDKQFRFVSADFFPKGYRDPEGKLPTLNNVLKAVTLTNHPLMKGLQPVLATDGESGDAEGGIQVIYAEGEPMQLDDVRKLDADKLDAEQKQLLVDHKAELSAAELSKFGMVEAPKVTSAPAPKVAVAASDEGTVSIKADEYAALKANAEAGAVAMQRIEASEADAFVSARIEAGDFKAGGKDAISKFYLGLSADQREAFKTEVVANIQASEAAKLVGAKGVNNTADVDPAKEIQIKANELMKENKDLSIGDAISRVMADNKALAEQYNSATA